MPAVHKELCPLSSVKSLIQLHVLCTMYLDTYIMCTGKQLKLCTLYNIQCIYGITLLSHMQGFLRTLDTLEKFKAVSSDQAHNDKPIQTPLFVYCTTLMHSASLFNPLSLRESFEFVRCALECRQYVRIMNWIASGNVSNFLLAIVVVHVSY